MWKTSRKSFDFCDILLYWMNYSINIANGSKDNNLRVGAVLVTEDNKLVCSAYTDECSGLSWYEILLSKIEKINVNKAYYLFLTVNPLLLKILSYKQQFLRLAGKVYMISFFRPHGIAHFSF